MRMQPVHDESTHAAAEPGVAGMTGPPIRLSMQTKIAENGVTVTVIGEVDRSNSDRFLETLEAAAGRGVPTTVDLKDMTFIDAAGLRALARAARHRSGPSPLVVRSPMPFTCKLLAITGLDRALTIEHPTGVERSTPRAEQP